MCIDPVTALAVTSTALQIGGAIFGHASANKAHDDNERSALDSLKLKDHELSLEEVQQRIAASQQKGQAALTARSAEGDVQASAAARGVSGVTQGLLIGDISRQKAQYDTSVDRNTAAGATALETQRDAATAEARARIAGVPGANPLATGLKIAGSLTDLGSLLIKKK